LQPDIFGDYNAKNNSTDIKPIYDNGKQDAFFDEKLQKWIVKDKKISGSFYEKKGGKMETEIFLCDIEKYTEIEPFEDFGDGSIQNFNEALQVWEYTKKGNIVLEYEMKNLVELSKKQKLEELERNFNSSKLIVIQNGETMVIKHDTNKRREFMKNLEIVTNEYSDQKGVLRYWQHDDENNCIYTIVLSTYIWKYIFSDLFSFTSQNGFKPSIRTENEFTYEITKAKISNATTLEEIMKISYNLINPSGLVIDISIKAKEIFDNPNTPESIKEEIVKLTTEDGIHLIKKILC
jgi:hypothetical protein